MNLNDFTQLFDNPAVSVFNRSQSKALPVHIGPLYPLKWELLSFGNSQKSNSSHVMRLAPLVVPTFSDISFQEHSAVIPLRTIMKDYETTFNYAKNKDGAQLPCLDSLNYHKILSCMLNNDISPIGSLFDYMGFPVYADLFKLLDWSTFYFDIPGNSTISSFDSTSIANLGIIYPEFDGFLTYAETFYRNTPISLSGYLPFVAFLAYRTFNVELNDRSVVGFSAIRNFYKSIVPNLASSQDLVNYVPTNDELIKASIYPTMISAIDAYKSYLFGLSLKEYLHYADFSFDKNYSTLPLRAYFRFHYDWNTNGNFTDRDFLLERNVYTYEQALNTAVLAINSGVDIVNNLKILRELVTPVNRLWNDDFFTSLLPTSAVDNAVEIPANSTVLDLAKLTAWQKFVMRLSYSSRYRDVVWNIFKIKPSDARLQQSYPIFRKYDNIQIGETIQTSSSDVSSVLGSFAGRGYSTGRNGGYNIFCEEPCVVLDFVSLLPSARYADALHPLIHVDDILDFPIPDMDVLGNQPIYADLLSGDPNDQDTVLGYGRQYSEWLSNYNTVHGEFKTTLDYWALSRRFEDTPVINDDFLRLHPADDFSVLFSVPEAPHAYLDIYYNAHVTRHVHRNVRIKI